MFPDDETAERWFVESRWPDGIRCVFCDSDDINESGSHPTQPYRCRDCKRQFSVKVNSVMHGSKLGYRKWAIAIYQITTSLKGVSSMKLHRDLNVTQKTAWHLLHRIHEAYKLDIPEMSPKRLHRYVAEFEGRHNSRPQDTRVQMAWSGGQAAQIRGSDRAGVDAPERTDGDDIANGTAQCYQPDYLHTRQP